VCVTFGRTLQGNKNRTGYNCCFFFKKKQSQSENGFNIFENYTI